MCEGEESKISGLNKRIDGVATSKTDNHGEVEVLEVHF